MPGAIGVGEILDQLSMASKRPRYAFMVLNLLAEQASDSGRVGPAIELDGEDLTVRDWVATKLSRMAAGAGKRAKVEERVREALQDQLPPDLLEAQAMIDRRVNAKVRASGADNLSRVLGELEAAGYLTRFYEGDITRHHNRGGRRLLVVVVSQDALAALRRRSVLV